MKRLFNKETIDLIKSISKDKEEENKLFSRILSICYDPETTYELTHISSQFKNINNPKELLIKEESDSNWDWVEDEYISLFVKIGKQPYKRETLSRMKELFSKFPEIRKDDVIGATRAYMSHNFGMNPKYFRHPHYFIKKGRGNNATRDILNWIEVYREEEESQNNISSSSRSKLL